eukprot:7045010-Karenia_brevis.AAC.1
MIEPLGRQPELRTSKKFLGKAARAPHKQMIEPLGRQPELRTSKNLWEGSQSPAQINDRTFGEATTAPHKKNLWEAARTK